MTPAFKAGEVMGCAMDIVNNRVVFTRNGDIICAVLPDARRATIKRTHDIKLDDSALPSNILGKLMSARRRTHDVGLGHLNLSIGAGCTLQTAVAICVPNCVFAITLEDYTTAHVNLGQEPFVFDVGKHLNKPTPIHTQSIGSHTLGCEADDRSEGDSDMSAAANTICQMFFNCEPADVGKLPWLPM